MTKNDIESLVSKMKPFCNLAIIQSVLESNGTNSIEDLSDSAIDEVYLQLEQINNDLEIP
jgi:hypothetical protein